MIKAVIFDMDGLLIDSEPFWQEAEQAAFADVGVKLSVEDMQSTMGRRIDDVVAHWYHLRPWVGKTQKDVEADIVDRVITLVKTKGVARAGVIETLDFFKNKFPMAVASSSSLEIINAVVDSLKIRDYFVELFSAEHETHGKPHPGVFITTANHLGVRPDNCLVFEDSPSGVLASKAAKMKCIAVSEKEFKDHAFIQTADVVLDSLEHFNQKVIDQIQN